MRKTVSRKRSIKVKQLSYILTAAVVFVLLALLVNEKIGLFNLPTLADVYEKAGLSETSPKVGSDFSVSFIDVGQGDCIFITSNGKNMLIDAGESGNEQTVLDYLSEQNVTQLDYVVATHPHTDHIGSLAGVINAMTVKTVIMPQLDENNTPTTKTYERFLTAVHDSGADVIAAAVGSDYLLGGAQFEVLSPREQDDELNNMSVVIRLTYSGKSFLFMGDAEKAVEKQLLASGFDLTADVIKLGHHGSSTSSSKKFIEAVAPEYAVICCGTDNSYGHPHKETLELMKKENISVLRTDESGTIVIGVENSELVIGRLPDENTHG